MRKETLARVAEVLEYSQHPLTVRNIMDQTGFSINTVTGALSKLGAVADHYHPAGWIKAEPQVAAAASIGTTDNQVAVDVKKMDRLPERWEQSREQVGNHISTLKIEPGSDIKQLSDEFRRAAESLTSVAYTLNAVRENPDWYELISKKD